MVPRGGKKTDVLASTRKVSRGRHNFLVLHVDNPNNRNTKRKKMDSRRIKKTVVVWNFEFWAQTR